MVVFGNADYCVECSFLAPERVEHGYLGNSNKLIPFRSMFTLWPKMASE